MFLCSTSLLVCYVQSSFLWTYLFTGKVTVNITSLSDIAGRVARGTFDADRVTVGGVCLPSGAIKLIRKRIPKDFPKWKNATDQDVKFVVDLILGEALSASATSIQKIKEPWENFWSQATDAHKKAASLSHGTISFIKAASVLKFYLFGQAATLTAAHAIKIGTIPRMFGNSKELVISDSLIFDDEIQGVDNIDAFMDVWKRRNEHQPLTRSIGIRWEIKDISLKTELQERLLILPDYVAGISHFVQSESNTLSASHVSDVAAHSAHARLSDSSKFLEILKPFDLQYEQIFPMFLAR